MPLRDHFRPPLADRRTWEGLHGGWPMMIVTGLNQKLPRRYIAEPQVHLGSTIEIDVATYEEHDAGFSSAGETDGGGGVATAVWAPPLPTLAVASNLPDLDEYEVRIYDTKRASGSWPPSRSSARLTKTGLNTVAPSSPNARPCSKIAFASRLSIS